MARITRVKKCRKAQKPCGKCGDALPKGSAYIHWSPGFRGRKRARCAKTECHPRPSEMTANDRLSRLYAAQENIEDALSGWDREDKESIEEALNEAAGEAREVGEEYTESAETINETAEGSPIAEECTEKAESCESWADALESAAGDLEDKPDPAECEAKGCKDGKVKTKADDGTETETDCTDCETAIETWATSIEEAAQEASSELEL